MFFYTTYQQQQENEGRFRNVYYENVAKLKISLELKENKIIAIGVIQMFKY